jgi:hypothetical protein
MGLNYGFEWDLRIFNGISWVSKKDLMGKTSEDNGNIMGFHRKTWDFMMGDLGSGFFRGMKWELPSGIGPVPAFLRA